MNIVKSNSTQITQIHARQIDHFIDVFKKGDVWRCRLKLKNGMTVPAFRWMSLNEFQLNPEARILLYSHISKNINIEEKTEIIKNEKYRGDFRVKAKNAK